MNKIHKKKLLVFHPALAPYRIDFFNSLNQYFDSTFYFFNENLMNQKFDQDRLTKLLSFKCHFVKRGFNIYGRSFRFGVSKILEESIPDIVLCPEFNLVTLTVVLLKTFQRKKIKIYSICDDNILIAQNATFLKKIVRSFLLKKLDGIILTHEAVLNLYKSILNPRAKLLLFPILRDENIFRKNLSYSLVLANRNLNKFNLVGKKVVLFVGRIVKVKNLERLIKSFKRINEEDQNTILVIVGSGGEESFLNQLAIELNLEKYIYFVGRREGPELTSWYNLADTFILPSTSEPFGAVITEALIAGCFVLCSKFAGAASLIVENNNGLTFDPYSIDEIYKAIKIALNKSIPIVDKVELKKSRMPILYQEAISSLMHQIK